MFLIHQFVLGIAYAVDRLASCGHRGTASRPVSTEAGSESDGFLADPESSSQPSYQDATGRHSDIALTRSFTSDYQEFPHSKRAVLIGLVNILIYHCLSVIAFSFVFEKWPIIDSIYFAVVCFTTVGFGDLVPHSDFGKLFVIFFAFYGIIILGFFISVVGELVIDMQDAAMTSAKKNASMQVLKMFSSGDASERASKPRERTLIQEFLHVLVLEAPILVIISLVAIAIGSAEGWSIIQSLYFCVITSTTIGFGDLHPDTIKMKIVAIIFLPFAVAVFGEVLGRVAGVYFERKVRASEKEFLSRQLTLSDLTAMDLDEDGKVSMGEFLSFMLVAMQKVDQEDMDEVRALFHSLDLTQTGCLEKADLVELARSRQEKLAARGPPPGS